MKILKKTLSLLLVFAMVFALAACGEDPAPTTTAPTQNPVSADKSTYTVKLTTAGGMALSGHQVMVYSDAACTDLLEVGTTDANGNASWSLAKGGQYYFKLDDTQLKGYDVKDSYAFNGTTANITLTSSLIQGEDFTSGTFKLGDVMYDFSFTDTEGNLVQLSEVLAEQDLVVLNFWYVDCSACVSEFPVLEQAYKVFSNDATILAINPTDDSPADVAGFKANMELTFPMGNVSSAFRPQNFIDPKNNAPCGGYPTSIFVDRYGVICLIEVGAMTSLTEWSSILSHFIGDEYEQKLAVYADELVVRMKPTVADPTSDEIDAALSSDGLQVSYRFEEKDEYAWPFLPGEKEGVSCIYASNSNIYESYSILYADVTMEAGDVLAFDYWASSEQNYDVLYVIVDDQPIYTLSGVKDGWQSAYCWIADKPGTYELALCFQKDTDGDEGEDNCYISNLRIVDVTDIDTPSYLPRQAANEQADGSFQYVDIYLNENDGYYHVGSVDGPLLLAGVYDFTQFSQEEYIYAWASSGQLVLDGHDYYEDLLPYVSASTNSNLVGWCTVTEELAELLKIVAQIKGFYGDENEWMLLCKYYDAYGTNGVQLEDPVAGLKTWSALTALEGKGVESNYFYYNGNPIMPRGKLARFTPTVSGVYRITSTTDYNDSLDAWIFDKDYNMLMEYTADEKLTYMYCDSDNVTMVMYMEAGRDYYIDIAPYDVYAVCTVRYDIEFVGESYDVFRCCSIGPFTYIEDGPSDNIIILGIDVVMNPEDGYYHEDLGKDENGNQIYGSIIYAYFTGGTAVISTPIHPAMIQLGAFDFSMDETDHEVLAYYKQFDYDKEKTLEYLNSLDVVYDMEVVNEIFEGIYHGEGADYTEEIRTYLDKMIAYSEECPELEGCVPVDARLAELLQMIMDKYTFEGVVNSWLKMCFYYDHLGPRQ